jgi:hypothetical protein
MTMHTRHGVASIHWMLQRSSWYKIESPGDYDPLVWSYPSLWCLHHSPLLRCKSFSTCSGSLKLFLVWCWNVERWWRRGYDGVPHAVEWSLTRVVLVSVGDGSRDIRQEDYTGSGRIPTSSGWTLLVLFPWRWRLQRRAGSSPEEEGEMRVGG